MKLRTKLVFSYSVIALFLVAALTFAYRFCSVICSMHPASMGSGMMLFLLFALASLALALGLSLYFATKISVPLRTLTAKTQAIAGGNYKEQILMVTNTAEMDALITSVNSLAATLDTQQKIKRRMANDYAHEFRTPLATIQSNLEGIIDGVFEPTNQRLESIRAEILRLCRMVSQMDKIVALEDDDIALLKEHFDLGALLMQTLSPFEAGLAERTITLAMDIVPCEITADRDKLASVIVNLMSNAIKYTDRGGKIAVSLLEDGSHATMTFADNGIGIAAGDLAHIFEHLYRTDISRTRDTGGSGIGLSMVKAVVAAHGGSVSVKSEVGVGSVFTVTIPK